MTEVFDSAVRSAGDLAGVYEYDGDTGYFYLYDTRSEDTRKVIAAISVLAGRSGFEKEDVAIRWDSTEGKVGLFICEQLWAAFDTETGAKYGGNYRAHGNPEMPVEIAEAFEEEFGESSGDTTPNSGGDFRRKAGGGVSRQNEESQRGLKGGQPDPPYER